MRGNQERLEGRTIEQQDSKKYQAVVVDLEEYKRRKHGHLVPEVILDVDAIPYVSETELPGEEAAAVISEIELDPKILNFPSRLLIPTMEDHKADPSFPNRIVYMRDYLKKKKAEAERIAKAA